MAHQTSSSPSSGQPPASAGTPVSMATSSSSSSVQSSVILNLIDLTAGSCGGIANVMVGQPLDTIKVKMQTFPALYNSMFQCLRTTLRNDGILRGLYAGTTPALAANIAENSVLFAAYGNCQTLIMWLRDKRNQSDLTTLDKASSGFLAAFFSSLSTSPTELIKCKLQAMREMTAVPVASNGGENKLNSPQNVSNRFNGTKPKARPAKQISAIRLTAEIIKNEGISRGLFRGLSATLVREMPGYFFFFGGYELTKVALTDGKPEEAGLVDTIIAGGVGGVVLWTAIFPFDLVKSRIQVEGLNQGMFNVMFGIIRKSGFRSLYKGLTPTLLRTFPSTGALFVAYEYSKDFMTIGANRLNVL